MIPNIQSRLLIIDHVINLT